MFFPIGELCDDILVEVFEHLDAETLKKASLVCKRWSDLIGSSKNTMNKFIWRLKSQHDRRPWSSHWLPNFNEILSLQRRPQAIEVTLMSQEELERFTKISECHGAQVRTFEIKCFMKFDIKEQIKILRNMPMLEKLELYTFAGCEEIQNDELNLIASLKSLQALTIWNTQKSNTNNWEIFKLLRCIDASKIKELRLCNKSSTSYEEPRFEAFDDQSDLIIEFLSAAINLKALRMCETVFLNVFKEKQSQFPLRFLFRLKKFTVDCDIPEFLRPDQPRSTNHDKITKCFLDFLDSQSSSLEEFNGEYNFQREVFEAIFTKLLNVKDLRIKFSILPIDRRFYDNLKPMMKLRAIGSMYQFAEEVAAEGMLKYCPEILKLEEDYFYRFEWLNENSFKGIIKFISIHNPKIEILCVKSIYTKLESFSKFQSLKQVKIDKISDRKLLINFIKINPTIEAISVLHYEGKKLKPKDLHDFVFHPRLSKLKFNWTCQGVKKNLDRFMEKDSKLKSWIVSKVHDRGIYLLFKK